MAGVIGVGKTTMACNLQKYTQSVKYLEKTKSAGLNCLYAKGGKYTEAIFYLERALSVDPHQGRVYENCAKCYLQLNDHEKARRLIDRALRLNLEVNPKLLEEVRIHGK